MGEATYTLGASPRITIAACAGDLRVDGYDGDVVILSADELPPWRHEDAALIIEHSDGDLRLRVPQGAELRVERIEGDASVGGIAAVGIDHVEGDLMLRDIARACTVRHVEGDLTARNAVTVSLGAVEGDVALDGVTGTFALERVEGDAVLRGAVGGFGPAHIEGDLDLELSYAPGGEYVLTVEGDAAVLLPRDADLVLEAAVGGDVTGLQPAGVHERYAATFGEGRARLTLTVAGDVRVQQTDQSSVSSRTAERNADPQLAVLEALARGEISTAEAEDLLSARS